MKRFRVPPALGAVLAGALGVLAFAPFRLWPLAPLSLGALFYLWFSARSRWQVFGWSVCWAMGLFGAGVSWIYVSLHQFGGMPMLLAALATSLFCVYLSLYVGLAGLCFRWLVTRVAHIAWMRVCVAAASFTLFEYLRGYLFSGFPWLTFGYSQTPGGFISAPLTGLAPLVGAYGISFVLALTASAVAFHFVVRRSARGPNRDLFGVIVAIWVVGVGANVFEWTSSIEKPLAVTLVQGNVDQKLKWRADEFGAILARYDALAASAKGELVVLPETALPGFLEQIPPEYLAQLRNRAIARNQTLVFGIPIAETGSMPHSSRYANSAITLDERPPQRYDKRHLVAFGEFIPPYFAWVYRWLSIPLADFSPREAVQKPLLVKGVPFAVNICYEDAFGADIGAQASEAELLVNISNMAWFGHSLAADQHAQMSQMRARETEKWMVRSTNTGLTAAINANGEVVSALPQYVTEVLEVRVERRSGVTPYSRAGDWPFLGLILLVIAITLASPFTKSIAASRE